MRNSPSRSTVALLGAGFLLVVAAVLGVLWLIEPGVEPAVSPIDTTDVAAAGTGSLVIETMDEAPPSLEPSRQPAPDPETREPDATTEQDRDWRKTHGILSFTVTDGTTGKPIISARGNIFDDTIVQPLGVQHGELLAPSDIGGSMLPEGRYELYLAAEGFEPAHRTGLDVFVGERTNLGDIEMWPGTSVLRGTVHGVDASREIRVELVGPGRSPCPDCVPLRDKLASNLILDWFHDADAMRDPNDLPPVWWTPR